MTIRHRCLGNVTRVVLNEGDDVLVERCGVCGKIRFESDGVRPMAWFAIPRKGDEARGQPPVWVPYTYAYTDPHNTMDAPEVWKHLESVPPEDA